MTRIKKEPHYKGSNPKLERIKTILKFSKALEKLILNFQLEEALDNNNSNSPSISSSIITSTSSSPNPNPNPKRRGRPKKNEVKDNNNNNNDNEVKEEKQEQVSFNLFHKLQVINRFDEKAHIDYTGINELMNNNADINMS